jgi:6-phosphogluconolactonase (cycloisomerase 2 family)
MKFRKLGQIALAVAASLGVTACGPPNTIDFLYVTASKQNQVEVYSVDSSSGSLLPLTGSPFAAGRNPVAAAASPNGQNLYVVNHDDSTVITYAISSGGQLSNQQTCSLPGTFPTQLAVNPAGTFLYVVETYQPKFSSTTPGPGALVAFPINANGTLGATSSLCTPVANGSSSFFPAGNSPVAVNVLAANAFVYVVNENDPSIYAFQAGTNGVLTQIGNYTVGVSPNAIASDPTSKFLYVTDAASNQVVGFVIQTNGTLVPMQRPFSAGNLPDSIVADPRGQFVLVANYNANTVQAYSIDRSNGNLSANATTPTLTVDTGPTCILLEPALGRYLYSTNFLGNSISGQRMDPNSGALTPVQNSPFLASGQPTCSAAITHGNHSLQAVQP